MSGNARPGLSSSRVVSGVPVDLNAYRQLSEAEP